MLHASRFYATVRSLEIVKDWRVEYLKVPVAADIGCLPQLQVAAHIHEHGTLCGAPITSETTLEWLRQQVLKPYGLPDILDLPYTQAGRLFKVLHATCTRRGYLVIP